MRSLVIDTDTASDDAVALMMALRHPATTVPATTVVGVDQAAQNALYVVELCGGTAPVHAGAAGPLVQDLVTAQEVHGRDGTGDIGLPVRGRTPAGRDAVDVLIDTFLARPGEIDLVTLGPLTNVAPALTRSPEPAGAVGHCYIMGGTGAGPGNVTPLAEYNFWADPEAAAVVVRSPMPETIIGWDISVASATFSPEEAARLRSMGTPYAEVAVDCQAVVDSYARNTGLAGFDLPDPITMAVALNPSIASTSHVHVDVLTGAGPARGVQHRLARPHRQSARRQGCREGAQGFLPHRSATGAVVIARFRRTLDRTAFPTETAPPSAAPGSRMPGRPCSPTGSPPVNCPLAVHV